MSHQQFSVVKTFLRKRIEIYFSIKIFRIKIAITKFIENTIF